MPYEQVLAMHVTDQALYTTYRQHMLPILESFGGGFRYDFEVANVLKSASDHPINRVFALYFGSEAQKDAFFADPRYLAVREAYFDKSVNTYTTLGGYERE